MDVRCGRCGTEYDFDDALISERGTTVKCTSCGHQFKVFPRAAGSGPERWVVRTHSGHELVFTSLRDLQRAISRGQVGPDDLLSRGNTPPRALRAIAELEPFFHSGPPGEDRQPRTLHGVAPPPRTLRDPAPSGPQVVVGRQAWEAHGPPPDRTLPLPGQSAPRIDPRAPSQGIRPDATLPAASQPVVRYSEPAPVASTQPAFGGASHTPPYGQPVPTRGFPVGASPAELLRSASSGDLTRTRPTAADPAQSPSRPHQTVIGLGQTVPTSSAGAPQPPGFGSTLPMSGSAPQPAAYGPVNQPVRPSSFRPAPAAPPPGPSQMQAQPVAAELPEHRYSSDDLEADVRSAGLPRRARARWVFALVLVAMVVLLGVTVGRRYIATATKPTASAAPVRDERVAQLLKEASRFLDQGAFEDAKEQLDKAAVLAEKDPAVLAQSARLESVRADTEWLRLRLLDPTNTDLVRSTHRELGARVGRAEAALARAARAASDPVVARASIDVLRMKGDLAQARSKAAALGAAAKDNAYVLAALDLAEDSPAFNAVVDRLSPLAASDTDARRAQAALIYALARDGRQADAEAELEKVKSASSPHPLLAELENFVGRMHAALDAGRAAPSASVAAVDPRALGALDTSPMPAGAAAAPAAGDFRATLKQASDAAHSGNASRAEQLYQSALSQHPGDTEALTGLGDLAKSHGDLAKAGSYYEQVLKQNPSYLPALMGSADGKWAGGDRKGAVTLYRRIVEQAGAGSTYFQRAQSRIKEYEAPAAAPTSAAQPKPTSTAAPAPPPAVPGDVDTTDLKGIE